MALTKGLILCINPTLTEEQLKASHGLEIKNWKKVIKDKNFEDLQITFTEGTFSELITATENMNYLRANSSEINWHSYLKAPEKGTIITLKQLIQYFPDLDKEHQSWISEKLIYGVIKEYSSETPEKKQIIKLAGVVEEDILKLFLPDEYCKSKTIEYTKTYTLVKFASEDWYPNITQKWNGAFKIGDACIIPTLPNDIGLSLLTSMYAISYVFGMLARYYPSVWISLRRVEKGDRIYPFAIRTLGFIQEKFPRQILDFLNSPYNFENK
jgi:hypothetical protein